MSKIILIQFSVNTVSMSKKKKNSKYSLIVNNIPYFKLVSLVKQFSFSISMQFYLTHR